MADSQLLQFGYPTDTGTKAPAAPSVHVCTYAGGLTFPMANGCIFTFRDKDGASVPYCVMIHELWCPQLAYELNLQLSSATQYS